MEHSSNLSHVQIKGKNIKTESSLKCKSKTSGRKGHADFNLSLPYALSLWWHILSLSLKHTQTQTDTDTHSQTHIHKCTNTHRETYTNTHTNAHSLTEKNTQTHTHKCTHTHRETYTNTNAHSRKHTFQFCFLLFHCRISCSKYLILALFF